MGTNHAHVDAAFLAIILMVITYSIDWVLDLGIPTLLFNLPSFLVLFMAAYLVLYVVMWIAWNRQ